jgi:hypothetical protein
VSFNSRLFGKNFFGFIFGSNWKKKETETGMTTFFFLSLPCHLIQSEATLTKQLERGREGERGRARERERERGRERGSQDLIVLITCVSCLPYAQGSSEEDTRD